VLSDTVGFVHGLPHTLVAAFRATLEETVQANLLLHVVDAAHPDHDQQVSRWTRYYGPSAQATFHRSCCFNKIDLLGLAPAVARNECGKISRIWVSASRGAGSSSFVNPIEEHCTPARVLVAHAHAVAS
jgi:GTPase